MAQFSGSTQAAVDYNSTIIGALELSEKKWVLAVQLPGVSRHSRHVLEACGDGLASFVERLKARCAAAGRKIARVILTHEAGRDGFWLARFLARRGIEVHVIQPSSLPVDRRARRAKTDIIDVEMLLRTLMAWLRGEPRVCSMVPIPSEADEEARRACREREDLTGERRSIVNKIDGILATLGALSDLTLAASLAVVGSGHEQPVPIFQQLARGHPSGRDDVRAIPAVAAQRRGFAGRARDRHQPRDRPVLVEPIWPHIRRRDPKEARSWARGGGGCWARGG